MAQTIDCVCGKILNHGLNYGLNGGFQLLDLIIPELKSHVIPYRPNTRPRELRLHAKFQLHSFETEAVHSLQRKVLTDGFLWFLKYIIRCTKGWK